MQKGDAMQESRDLLRKACNDMVCAVRDNPNAFRHVRITHAPIVMDVANQSPIRNVSIFGAISVVFTKLYLAFGGHV